MNGWRRPLAPIATRLAWETAQVSQAISHSIPQAMKPPPDAFFPSHLSVALVDAVFGARSDEKDGGSAAERYCRHFAIARTRPERWLLPPVDAQETVAGLVARYERLGVETMAATVFRDIARFPGTEHLRAGYVVALARALRRMGVDTLQDMGAIRPSAFDAALRVEAGFDADVVGLLLSYSGGDDFVWGNGAVCRFVGRALERETVSAARAEYLVRRAAFEIILSPRHVDYRIRRGGLTATCCRSIAGARRTPPAAARTGPVRSANERPLGSSRLPVSQSR